MRVLVIGSGGREHALAWRLAREPGVTSVLATPGNPGMAGVAMIHPSPGTVEGLADLAASERVDLTVVGPELPLSQGIADVFRARGLPVVGPTRAAAALEWSKGFAKSFMERHGIPTARYRIASSLDEAQAVVDSGELGFPVVVKADGLAAGKGVVIAHDRQSAVETVTAMMQERRFGDAGATVVLEERLSGPELSFFVLSDGERAIPIGTAQDHKRAFDGDEGPNTGGMGAFSPSPLCDAALERRILREIVRPVIDGMRQEGYPYAGFLYCGLMLTSEGPRVIEFNVRFGDPEAQVVLPRVTGDLLAALIAAAAGDLRQVTLGSSAERTVGVVLASGGYPDAFETGRPITGLEQAAAVPQTLVFHAGTTTRDHSIVTSGGRVITVVGRGIDFATARARAYDAAALIRFDNLHLRHDIGVHAVALEAQQRA